jgi:hypothetical protein
MARATRTSRRSPPRRTIARSSPLVTPPHRISVRSPPETPIRVRPTLDAETPEAMPSMFRFLEDALGPDETFTGSQSVVRRLTYDGMNDDDELDTSFMLLDETFVSTIIMNNNSFELVNSLDLTGDLFVFGDNEDPTEIANE